MLDWRDDYNERAVRQMQTAKGIHKLLFSCLVNQANVTYSARKLLVPVEKLASTVAVPPEYTFSLVPSFASLLSGEASVLILHFSLAAFLQHLEDTFSGAGVHRGPGEPCTTEMVHTKNKKGDNIVLAIKSAFNVANTLF